MKIFISLLLLCFVLQTNAQQKDSTKLKMRNNTITANVGGEGFQIGPTVAFEKSFIHKKWLHVGIGIGGGKTWGIVLEKLCFPTYLNTKFGKKRHYLEINIGVNHLVDPNPYPNTKSERAEFKKNPPFHVDSFRPPYTPSYFATINYVFRAYNGFVFKVGGTGSRTNLLLTYPTSYFLLPRISIGYAF